MNLDLRRLHFWRFYLRRLLYLLLNFQSKVSNHTFHLLILCHRNQTKGPDIFWGQSIQDNSHHEKWVTSAGYQLNALAWQSLGSKEFKRKWQVVSILDGWRCVGIFSISTWKDNGVHCFYLTEKLWFRLDYWYRDYHYRRWRRGNVVYVYLLITWIESFCLSKYEENETCALSHQFQPTNWA